MQIISFSRLVDLVLRGRMRYKELKNTKILESKEWQDFLAVIGGMVAIADGNKYSNRPSVTSILGTAEIVAEIIIQS